jgi:hypothetical protein
MSLPSPVAVDNMMSMPILEDNVPQYNIDQELSMYIPYVSADGEFIKDTIEDFGFGKVKRVDCVVRGNDDSTSMAFIHMEHWEENALVENFQDRIKSSDKEARIVYDDPKYWIILPNKNPVNVDVNEKMNNMQSEIDILRNENEELNEKFKKLQWFINLHEANIEYLCKEITKLKTENIKTSSEEDSDNYVEDEYDDNVIIRKKKRIRSSPVDITCGSKSDAWEPSSSSNEKNNWVGRLRPRENGVVMKPHMYSEC